MKIVESQNSGIIRHTVWKVRQASTEAATDFLAIEAPLEINLSYGAEGKRNSKPISITMRTPGQDLELALGFLFTEGIIQSMDQVASAVHMDTFLPESDRNRILVSLHASVEVDLNRLERHFYTTSSCGVCGKSSIEAIRVGQGVQPLVTDLKIDKDLIHQLPGLLRKEQSVFESTGGLHGCALFDLSGEMLILREDVGRHNALDKLIGAAFQAGSTPLTEHILLLSGRISFELVQKALLAGITIIVAVGAPSSLAVALAAENGITLAGFVREGKYNVYTHPERILYFEAPASK